jgi:hypothetical protein
VSRGGVGAQMRFCVQCSSHERSIGVAENSTETDDVRVVVLMPSYEWGGEGCLGADIGYGYLHRLPAKCCATLGRSSGKKHDTVLRAGLLCGHSLIMAACSFGRRRMRGNELAIRSKRRQRREQRRRARSANRYSGIARSTIRTQHRSYRFLSHSAIGQHNRANHNDRRHHRGSACCC